MRRESSNPATATVSPPPLQIRAAGPRVGYGAAMRNLTADGQVPDSRHMHQLLRRAASLGVPLIDTAGSYFGGISETIVAEALAPYPPELIIATKGGVCVSTQGRKIIDARPEQLKSACEMSLRRLRVDTIDLFQLHWPDPAVPLAEQVGALAELKRAGKIRHVGLCNVTLPELIESERIVTIASVQSPFGLQRENDLELLSYAGARGMMFLAYGPLAILRSPPCEEMRRVKLRADQQGCTLAQFALDWALRQGPHVTPIPGTVSVEHLQENMVHSLGR